MKLTTQKFQEVCSSCQIDCCRKFDVFLSEFDKDRIRKINKDPLLFNGNFFNTEDRKCPFYDTVEKKCTIYEYRPLDCRLYPYAIWFERGQLELWTDPKCALSKHLAEDQRHYEECLELAKKELVYWSEGEVFSYLISEFNIQEFKRQVYQNQNNQGRRQKRTSSDRVKRYSEF